jgi:putative oxidoreductase
VKKFFFMLGRICLSFIFICAVANQILNWDATHQDFVTKVYDWIVHPGLPDKVQKVFNFILSHSSIAVLIGAILTGLGGLMVLLGIKARLGAILLILFLIPTTVIMHAFWMYNGSIREMQMVMFLKNLSIIGGLFILASCNTGGEE